MRENKEKKKEKDCVKLIDRLIKVIVESVNTKNYHE